MIEKKKLSLKGMTLMEIIIAIAVMAIISMIVVMAGVSAVHNMRIAHNVSEKNAAQSPFASAKLNSEKKGEMTIDLKSDKAGDGKITVDTYEVKQAETTGDRVGNYRYFVVHPTPTASPTTSPTISPTTSPT
jgi:prepilin-type N-terminal cleavage/methylation domain-containing protein